MQTRFFFARVSFCRLQCEKRKILIKPLLRYLSRKEYPGKHRDPKITSMRILRIYWDYYFANLDRLFPKVCAAGVY
jgi:hypothetical protein